MLLSVEWKVSFPVIIAHTFFYTKEELLFVTLQQEFDCKEPSPQNTIITFLKILFFWTS